MKRYIIGLILCVSLFQTSNSIKCYNCQSTSENDCTDLKKVPSIECQPLKDAFPPVCIRKLLKSTSGTNITLQCTDRQTGNECDPPSINYSVEACHMCQENYCNGGDSVKAPILTTLFTSSLAIYLFGKFV